MKFAYLIMAHHRFSVLKLLLEDLDDSRNDIFLHIDSKTKTADIDVLQSSVKKANLVLVKRMPVYWGDYSQIKCVMRLIKAATEYGYHDYYHLLVGVEYPLKSQDYIYKFFEENKGKEFIGYDWKGEYLDRVRYWYFFSKYARSTDRIEKSLFALEQHFLLLQRKIGINRIKKKEDYFKKGYANWSITHELALYILDEFRKIKGTYKYTKCADEIIIHTIVYHSKFYSKVYDIRDEYRSAMRLTTWEDPHNQLHLEDYDKLIHSDKLFARKFDDDNAEWLIRKIYQNRIN